MAWRCGECDAVHRGGAPSSVCATCGIAGAVLREEETQSGTWDDFRPALLERAMTLRTSPRLFSGGEYA